METQARRPGPTPVAQSPVAQSPVPPKQEPPRRQPQERKPRRPAPQAPAQDGAKDLWLDAQPFAETVVQANPNEIPANPNLTAEDVLSPDADTIIEANNQIHAAPMQASAANATIQEDVSQFVQAAKSRHEIRRNTGAWNVEASGPQAKKPQLFQAGERLGKYVMVKELGRGAMGVVMLAEQEELRRQVALKILPPNLNTDDDAVYRFQREAEAVARLAHPGIIRLYDFGFENSTHFYAMEVVHGKDLSDLLKEERSSYQKAARLIRDCAEALNYAHTMGVLHRDIKPANILIDEKNQVRLTDFGLARLDGSSSLTMEGTILGTPLYMPPEQANGERRLTRQADIYSLGATLYELATGRSPYDGRNAREILLKVIKGPPRAPNRVDPHIPKDLAAIINKAMARNPGDRYRTAADFAEDLKAFIEERPVTNASVHAWANEDKRNTALFVVFGLVSLFLIGAFIVSLDRKQKANKQKTIEDLKAEIKQLKSTRGQQIAETPDLDESIGEALEIGKNDLINARIEASKRDVEARMALDSIVRSTSLNADTKKRVQALIEEAKKKREQEDFGSALVVIGEALDLHPFNHKVRLYKAKVENDHGLASQAIHTLTVLILDASCPGTLRDQARFLRASIYCQDENPVSDSLAEHDWSAIESSLTWQAQIELIKLHTSRHRFEVAFLLQAGFLENARQLAALGNKMLTKDQLANCYFRQAQLALKLGQNIDNASALINTARELSQDDELLERIDELMDIIENVRVKLAQKKNPQKSQ